MVLGLWSGSFEVRRQVGDWRKYIDPGGRLESDQRFLTRSLSRTCPNCLARFSPIPNNLRFAAISIPLCALCPYFLPLDLSSFVPFVLPTTQGHPESRVGDRCQVTPAFQRSTSPDQVR